MRKIFFILLLFPLLTRAQISIHIYASATTICHGTTAYFTDTVTGDSTPHYQWRVNGINTGVDSSIFTTDMLANGDTVQCLLVSNTGDTILATSNSIIITVQNTPDAGIITGIDSSVCVGSSITLSDSVPGGIWSASNTYAMVDSGVVTGVSGEFGEDGTMPSPDTIYYTLTNSCGSDSVLKIIVVNPLPDAEFYLSGFDCSPYSPLCVGSCLYVNCGEGAEGYMYATNGNASCCCDLVSGNHVGDDIIINAVTNSCGSDTDSVEVFVTATPTPIPILASSTKVDVGNTITLTDSTTAFFPYWSASNANAFLTDSSGFPPFVQILTGVTMGLETITLGVSNECGYAQSSIVITIDSTTNVSAFAPSNDEVTVYPNPSNDELVIHTSVAAYHSCSIINSAGQLVLQQTLNSPYTSIKITSLQAGTYFIIIEGDDKEYRGKFIKE